MRGAVLLVAALVAIRPGECRGESPGLEKIVAQVLEANAGRYSQIRSVRYTAELLFTINADKRTNQPGETPYYENQVEYLTDGPLFKVTSRYRLSPDGEFEEKIYAGNGEYYQGFRTNEARLTLSKHLPVGEVLTGTNVLFAPFMNLLVPSRDSPYLEDFTDLYANPANWDLVRKALLPESVKIKDGSLVLSTKISAPHSDNVTLETSFDPGNAFPVRWAFRDKKGEITYTFEVDELMSVPAADASDLKFLFPKKITAVQYGDGQPCATTVAVIKSIQVNGAVDKSDFTIDPSTARDIHDVDTQTVVPVPR